jgi:triphosphatase
LVCIFETHFYRRKLRVDSGETICEVSLDEGEIIADGGRAPISELEIELFSGKQEDMMMIGERIAEKYGLKPEPLSKYARGKSLTGGGE